MTKGFNYIVIGFFAFSIAISLVSIMGTVTAQALESDGDPTIQTYDFKEIFTKIPFMPEDGFNTISTNDSHRLSSDIIDDTKLVKCDDGIESAVHHGPIANCLEAHRIANGLFIISN
jgi:hypothetical protein